MGQDVLFFLIQLFGIGRAKNGTMNPVRSAIEKTQTGFCTVGDAGQASIGSARRAQKYLKMLANYPIIRTQT